jgi:hypothetical protein
MNQKFQVEALLYLLTGETLTCLTGLAQKIPAQDVSILLEE